MSTRGSILSFSSADSNGTFDSLATMPSGGGVIDAADTLSALVTKSIKADLLILLSDIDGLYTADPHKDKNATLISTVEEITEEIENLAGGEGSALAVGGMKTKISAAKICTESGADMIITNGTNPEVLYGLLDGKQIGTRFIAKK